MNINKSHICSYVDNIIKIEEFNFDHILLDKKSYGNILIYGISYKTLVGAKPLYIRFDKLDEFVRVYDGTRYLVLFGGKKYDFTYNRFRYLMEVKCGITFVISHNYVKKTKLKNSDLS